MVYFNDIFIYSKNLYDHLQHIHYILKVIRKERLYVNAKKCTYYSDKLIFLGFVVSALSIEADEKKVKVTREWPKLTTASEVRSYNGLVSLCCRFVKDFNSIATPLNELVEKDVKFTWIEK